MGEIEKFLTNTIKESVKESVKEAFDDVLDDMYEVMRRAKMKDVINTTELMELTGWSRRHCQYLRDEGKIDFIQDGRMILYPTAKVYQYFEDHLVERWEND